MVQIRNWYPKRPWRFPADALMRLLASGAVALLAVACVVYFSRDYLRQDSRAAIQMACSLPVETRPGLRLGPEFPLSAVDAQLHGSRLVIVSYDNGKGLEHRAVLIRSAGPAICLDRLAPVPGAPVFVAVLRYQGDVFLIGRISSDEQPVFVYVKAVFEVDGQTHENAQMYSVYDRDFVALSLAPREIDTGSVELVCPSFRQGDQVLYEKATCATMQPGMSLTDTIELDPE